MKPFARSQTRGFVKGFNARIVRWGTLLTSSADRFESLEGYRTGSDDGSDAEQTPQMEAWRFQEYGYRSRPRAQQEGKVGSQVIAVAIGGAENNRVIIASETPGTGPDDQEEGEVEVYSEFGQRIMLRQDGTVRIVAGTGGSATLDGGHLTVEDVVAAQHFSGRGAPPTIVPGTALSAGGTATVATGSTDTAMQIDFKAGPMGTSLGELCTITFAKQFDSVPFPAWAPLDDIAGGLPPGIYFERTSTTQLKVLAAQPPDPNSEFSISVHLLQ